jgi:hypothetical protein
MAGRFPPGPPRFSAVFLDVSHLPADPVGSSQVPQDDSRLDLNRYDFPPSRLSVSPTTEVGRTGSFITLSLPSEVVNSSSRAAPEQKD